LKVKLFLYNIYVLYMNNDNNSIIIAVMDRNNWKARTDIIVFINPIKKLLKWIPRDLYSETIKNRINLAYAFGGQELLLKCLNELKIHAKYCICVLPECFEENIKHINTIRIPVSKPMSFYYPLHRHKEIEKGKRIINFNPPSEILSGDRFHEWIGARYQVKTDIAYPDFDRIKRQQLLLKELLKMKNSFVYSEKNTRGINKEVLELLKRIDSTWIIEEILCSSYKTKKIYGMDVLEHV